MNSLCALQHNLCAVELSAGCYVAKLSAGCYVAKLSAG